MLSSVCNLARLPAGLQVLGAASAPTEALYLSPDSVTVVRLGGETRTLAWSQIAGEHPILYLTHREGMSKRRRFAMALMGLIEVGSGVALEEEGTCYLDLGVHGCYELGNPLRECGRREAKALRAFFIELCTGRRCQRYGLVEFVRSNDAIDTAMGELRTAREWRLPARRGRRLAKEIQRGRN